MFFSPLDVLCESPGCRPLLPPCPPLPPLLLQLIVGFILFVVVVVLVLVIGGGGGGRLQDVVAVGVEAGAEKSSNN